jgi:urea transport system permease protein
MNSMPRTLTMLVLLIAMVVGSSTVQAADSGFATLVKNLGGASFSAKLKAITALGGSGDSRAEEVLQAFLGRKLYTMKDGRVVIGASSGAMIALKDAIDGADLGSVKGSDVKSIIPNNRLRKALRGALGGLTLVSKDSTKRIAAADAVFRAPKANQIPPLIKAVDQETVPEVKLLLERALASAQLAFGKTPEERVAAIGILARQADSEVNARLRNLLLKNPDGQFIEATEAVRAAAQAALSRIQTELAIWSFLGKLFQGLSLASVLLLAAIGLAITFGVMGVINMAHGEMVMLGAYTTYVVQEIIRNHAPWAFDLSLAVAIPAAFLVSGAFGVAIERSIIRYLYARPLETLLATWGLSLVLQQMVRSIFGPTNMEVGNPTWMTGGIELAGGVLLTYNRIWIIVFSLIVLAALALLLKKTAFGLHMRAVTQNRRMASAMGIRTGWVDAMTFGLGSGIAGMAGVALSQIDNVSPNLGQAYIVDSFMVVVFGGIGNLLGTLLGATTLGIANKFLEVWSGAVLGKIFILIAVILFIQKCPRGLFALKGRAVEA